MKVVIVYDSVFGNTAEIARTIAAEFEAPHEVRLATVADAASLDPAGADLLIVGSPTRGFRPTPAIAEFVAGLTAGPGHKAAAFDTRINLDDVHPAPLRWVIEAGGYAADRIASTLREKGFALAGPPAGFLVGGSEGPLKPGEAERAKEWTGSLTA